MSNLSNSGLSESVIDKISLVFKNFPSIEKAVLYGSRAKGNFRPGSDIDLTLVGPSLTTTDLLKIENELEELLLPYTIDLSLHGQIDNRDLLDHINRVGIEIYNRRA